MVWEPKAGPRSARLTTVIAAATAAVAVGGCSKPAPQAPPPTEVSIETARPMTVSENYEFVGSVQAYRTVDVRTPVAGIIEARPIREGAVVQRGDVLFQIDRTVYAAAFRRAEARLLNATRNLERLRPLLADRAVAQRDVDDAENEAAAARAEYDEAKKNLDDTTVRAEIAGRVGKAQLELGARVTGSADLLTTIDRLDLVYVSFRPSSQQLLAWRSSPQAPRLLRPGSALKVAVTLPDGSTLPRTGTLDYVDPVLEPQTGTQEFRATFANPDRLLIPGQFVRVRLVGFERDSAITVPQRAVQQQLGRRLVYVVGAGDTVKARDIEVGNWTGDRWVVERGLVAGDRVVVDGFQKTGPGAVVRPVEASTAAAQPATGAAAPAAGANNE